MPTYQPKSKYQILQTSGNEYRTHEGTKYEGSYILTPHGAFAGGDITKLGRRLYKINKKPSNKINNIWETEDTPEYYAVSQKTRSIVNFIKKTKPIISTKTRTTKEDYQRGHYRRYFVKKVNTILDYFEVNRSTYQKIKAKDDDYDFYSWEVGSLIWSLEGNVIKANKHALREKSKRYPNVSTIFQNLSEFNNSKIINNQYANEGQLVYAQDTKKEYIGPYHIHPIEGPMVGAKHTSKPHLKLIFVEDLKKKPLYKPSPTGPMYGQGSAQSMHDPEYISEYLPSDTTRVLLERQEGTVVIPSSKNINTNKKINTNRASTKRSGY